MSSFNIVKVNDSKYLMRLLDGSDLIIEVENDVCKNMVINRDGSKIEVEFDSLSANAKSYIKANTSIDFNSQ